MVRAVHGEDLLGQVGPQHIAFRPRELQAHEHRQNTAHREKYEGSGNIAAADDLVIHRAQGSEDATRRSPYPIQLPPQRSGLKVAVAQVRWDFLRAHCRSISQADSAFSSRGSNGTRGMLLPGLIVCGSATPRR